jgi:hypothetical protein
MRVKFTKDWSGPYGVFVKGRVCELSGPMLAAAPEDVYEPTTEELKPVSKQAKTPADKQQKTTADKQVGTKEDDSKKEKNKKEKQPNNSKTQ